MIIENKNLLIRELVENDVNVIFELYSDREAMKFRGSKPFKNVDEALEMLKKVSENIKNITEFRYAIIEKERSNLIGTYLITPINKTECIIGCSIGKKYCKTGYGHEVMMLMTEHLISLN